MSKDEGTAKGAANMWFELVLSFFASMIVGVIITVLFSVLVNVVVGFIAGAITFFILPIWIMKSLRKQND